MGTKLRLYQALKALVTAIEEIQEAGCIDHIPYEEFWSKQLEEANSALEQYEVIASLSNTPPFEGE